MRIFNFKVLCRAICILGIGLFLANCEGEDGINGLDGTDGINGENGLDGENGENGVGFDELSKYGSITLNISGTRADGEAFTHDEELKFITNEEGANYFNTEGSTLTFEVDRANSPGVNVNKSAGSAAGFYLEVTDDSDFGDIGFFLQNYTILSDDLKLFTLDTYVESGDKSSSLSVTDYSFDTTTNELKCSFVVEIENERTTGNDMTISATIDVVVFENINIIRR
ncbi:hypothetical protein [Aquimarina mytili]|uniref:Collagen-like protein n=1 Tax=Aquimarina mytili TaxID=874423 RepID=A0A937A211_9FLAO|nr:hypothetical protein [Aquimarina mytili]MBL0683555.1 hypothetical protein [Aquimarina mytili]